MYLDKKYYPCVVLSESGEFLPLFFVYSSFSHLYLPLPFLTTNFMQKVQPKQLAVYLFNAFLSRVKKNLLMVILSSEKEMISTESACNLNNRYMYVHSRSSSGTSMTCM